MPQAPHATALAELDRRHVFHPFTSIAAHPAPPGRDELAAAVRRFARGLEKGELPV
jgi:hypothetical protein